MKCKCLKTMINDLKVQRDKAISPDRKAYFLELIRLCKTYIKDK